MAMFGVQSDLLWGPRGRSEAPVFPNIWIIDGEH